MARTHLRSHTLVLCFSIAMALVAVSSFVGCSSSDSGGTPESGGASAGKGGKGGATAGGPASDAGDVGVGGVDTGAGGADDLPGAGAGGKVAVGGAEPMGEAGEPGGAGAAGVAGESSGGDEETAAAIQRTKDLISGLTPVRQCPTCHQADYSGLGIWKNLTPDPTTGIGGEAWTDEKIKRAIHDGLDEEGDALCAQMEHYPFTPSQLHDLVVFLRNLKPIVHNITATCPKP
jgi:hypothetical protein